jgi:transcriptional regulator with XRE-family HTH domain
VAFIIRNRLAELMAEYGTRTGNRLSQEELSDQTGVAQSTISLYVTNQVKRYDMNVVSRFLRFFNISIAEFFVEIPTHDADREEDVEGEVVAVAMA